MESLGSIVKLLPDFIGHDVVIIGPPASGKSSLAESLKLQYENSHAFFHSDSYMNDHNYEPALYAMMEDMQATKIPKIIEGMQAYRLLRKGLEQKSFYPTYVIQLSVKRYTIEARYEKYRKGKDVQKALSWAAMHEGIWREYESKYNPHPPILIKINNDEV